MRSLSPVRKQLAPRTLPPNPKVARYRNSSPSWPVCESLGTSNYTSSLIQAGLDCIPLLHLYVGQEPMLVTSGRSQPVDSAGEYRPSRKRRPREAVTPRQLPEFSFFPPLASFDFVSV